MSIQGLGNNNFFNLNNIRSLAGNSNATSTGGSFTLGDGSGTGSTGSTNFNQVGSGDLGLGDVPGRDQNVETALNSVAGDSALQQQFRNQLALVNLQERVQAQSRTVEILTNILKARHDASLSAARNVK